jgi:transposase-like protein
MPWKASSVMEEKVRFVLEYEQDERTMTELCEVYGIARETGYVWLRRYRERGVAGLVEFQLLQSQILPFREPQPNFISARNPQSRASNKRRLMAPHRPAKEKRGGRIRPPHPRT